jgi:hypothetical protein
MLKSAAVHSNATSQPSGAQAVRSAVGSGYDERMASDTAGTIVYSALESEEAKNSPD